MKTIDICSHCLHKHNWREIDYDNILYVSEKNAICLTLCETCAAKFLETQQPKSSVIKAYKQKIEHILLTKSSPVLVADNLIFGWFGKSK
ncbi:MAG TPA: hypothetical protein VKG26_12915 [Bacteroidia bacterium]|nr:hypothetical protein [Bacteroidia bacterium]